MYTTLRASGMSSIEANKYKGSTPEKIVQVSERWSQMVDFISELKDVDADAVMSGLRSANIEFEDLEDRYKQVILENRKMLSMITKKFGGKVLI
jgi:hypothetical protein